MSMVMHGSEVPTVAGAYRPESSQSDNNKTTRMVEVTKPPVLGNYLVAATKVPFDGALPPVIRRYPVQHLRRSTGSSSPDSPRIESYHPAPKLLKPVALPARDAEGFTRVGRAYPLTSKQLNLNINLANAKYQGPALWAMHSAVPTSTTTIATAMPRSHANLGLLDVLQPAPNSFAALAEEDLLAIPPVQNTPKLGFWSRVASNILAIPVVCTVVGVTAVAAPALAMLGTTCVVANTAVNVASNIRSPLASWASSSSSSSTTMSMSSHSPSNTPHAAKKPRSPKKKTNKAQKKKGLRRKLSKAAPEAALAAHMAELQPTSQHKQATGVKPNARYAKKAVAAACALPTSCTTLVVDAVMAGVHFACSIAGAVFGSAIRGAGHMRSLLVRWH